MKRLFLVRLPNMSQWCRWTGFLLLSGTLPLFAQAADDAGATLMHHVLDSHQWRPFPFLPAITLHDITIGSLTVPITQHLLMLLINAALLVAVFVGAFHKKRIVPSVIGSALEPLLFFVRDALVFPAMGEKMGRQWLSFFYTLFLFILSANLMGLIPLFSSSMGNLSIAIALAVIIFVALIVSGMRKNGFIGFFASMIPEGLPLPIGIFMLFIEIPGLLIRSGVLAIRLFANMIAGHFVVASLLLLIFIVSPAVGVVAVPMALFIDLLEVLVAIIQAVVFTLLAAIFIKMATEHH